MSSKPKVRVLVVDDEEGARTGLEKLLRFEGYDVDTAADGASALERANHRAPDVVVTDLKMSGMGGLELLAGLRARYPDLPVIVVTAFGDVSTAVAAMRQGAEHYLVKPVDFDELQVAVDRAVERRALVAAALAIAERHALQLRGLAAASLAINSAGSLDAALRVVVDQARLLIDVHQAVASLPVAQDWSQAITAVSCSDEYAARHGDPQALDDAGLAREVCATNRPLRMTRTGLAAHPAWGASTSGRPPRLGWLGAPLIARDGGNLGLIHLSDRPDGDFTESDEAVLVQLAQTASVAVENARLYEETRRAVNVRDEVVAVVSHDLRNPLNALLMAVSMAEMKPLDVESLRARLGVIRRSAERMNHLIGDLLDVARLESGNMVLERARLPSAQLVDDVLQTQRALVESRSITLRAEVTDGLPAILADRERLFQVFANLVGNAVKFTPLGGAITVRAAPAGERVRFTVADTGGGIPPRAPRPRLRPLLAGPAHRGPGHGAGPVDRQGHRRGPPRRGVGRERRGPGQRVLVHAPGRRVTRSSEGAAAAPACRVEAPPPCGVRRAGGAAQPILGGPPAFPMALRSRGRLGPRRGGRRVRPRRHPAHRPRRVTACSRKHARPARRRGRTRPLYSASIHGIRAPA